MNTAKAHAKPKGHKISHMTIEPAEGGVISKLHMKAPDRGARMAYMPPPEPVSTVHSSEEHLSDHIRKHFGGMFPKPAMKGSNIVEGKD